MKAQLSRVATSWPCSSRLTPMRSVRSRVTRLSSRQVSRLAMKKVGSRSHR
jgi:hypothetical protein